MPNGLAAGRRGLRLVADSSPATPRHGTGGDRYRTTRGASATASRAGPIECSPSAHPALRITLRAARLGRYCTLLHRSGATPRRATAVRPAPLCVRTLGPSPAVFRLDFLSYCPRTVPRLSLCRCKRIRAGARPGTALARGEGAGSPRPHGATSHVVDPAPPRTPRARAPHPSQYIFFCFVFSPPAKKTKIQGSRCGRGKSARLFDEVADGGFAARMSLDVFPRESTARAAVRRGA